LNKGEWPGFPFRARGGVQGRIFQDIPLIFSPKVKIWDRVNYSKKKFEIFFARAPFARKKCAFSCIITLFFSDGWLWVSFSGDFLRGIHSHYQKCDWVQKVRTHSALLGTCAHFHAYLHFFSQMDGDGCHFWIFFYGEFIPIIKNAIGCKKYAHTQHF